MKKIILYILLTISSFTVYSQNLPNADFKRLQFGFHVGLNVLDFGIKPSMLAQDGKIYQSEVSTFIPGFSVGLIGVVRLNEYFYLRMVPTLNLGERNLTYMNDQTSDLYTAAIKTTSISVPLHVKYCSVRVNNVRPYLLLGGGVLFDFNHDKTKPVLLKYGDYFVEFGVGCTFYTEYFRLSPEIRFALGFNNILTTWEERLESPGDFLDPEFEKYTRSLSRLTSRIFTIALNFE